MHLTEVTIPAGCTPERRDLEFWTDWLNSQENSS